MDGNRHERILIVDDEASLRGILIELLGEAGYAVDTAESGEEAMRKLRTSDVDLVMTDIRMGRMSGIDLIRQIRATGLTTEIIVMTSNASLDTAIEALRLGAYDYILKPFENLEEVHALVGRALEKVRLVNQNRQLLDDLKRKNFELEQLNSSIRELAIRDGLTGLYNFRYFQEAIQSEVARSKRHSRPFCLIMLDVDHFKKYNDEHGHVAGDEVLRNIGRLLTERMRRTDIVARYGGEEFVIILPEVKRTDGLPVAEDVRRRIEAFPFKNGETQPLGRVTISLGLAEFPTDGEGQRKLIENADEALYLAKSAGRNRVCDFGAEKPSNKAES